MALAGLLVAGGLALFPPSLPEPPGRVRVSLLAVGDTGIAPGTQDGRQGRVGRALAAEDRRRPADGLLLLGDNFYPDGLRAEELVERVRFNLVRPYCRFVELAAPRSSQVADACPGAPGRHRSPRPPRPLLAVLGNHDYTHPASPGLQREAVPDFVANWDLLEGVADAVELGGGVSLVRVDSPLLYRHPEAFGAVGEALAAARGPWRILAMHHPAAPVDGVPEERAFQARLREVLGAHREQRVQLLVSGHEHNLAVLAMEEPYSFAHAVAGGGGGALREVEYPASRLLFGAEEPGFVRIDLVGAEVEAGFGAQGGAEVAAEAGAKTAARGGAADAGQARGDEARLRVSVLAATGWGILRESARRVAIWSVDLRGRVRSEAPPAD